ncbi:DUF3006 domain-containing protein [Alkaliphilus peptidifermentans]|uniref:DUF3006 domain-containing protein n=1 Tax=Alkaliphilus peptidifermentans DSM 18978 TaxID=1120976 RepID=A0A1G5CHA1_9FIRM|nr:DUF3006 domain-containing protein [Alkaliphilus peptidifermentans]SCY01681.1 Protein of unknown function [Alkaliphilus peptidifermentans DSM 18978]
MKKGIIDRFEGQYAVVEIDGGFQHIERGSLPRGAKEGDVIKIDGSKIQIDSEETNKRRVNIKKLMDSLFK